MYTQRKGEVPLEHYFTNNPYLKSEIKTITYEKENCRLSFKSDNGVFSKDKIDFGSRVLVETILKETQKSPSTLLDVGCGYGFMGLVLSKKMQARATLIDVNKRAVHLAKMNIKLQHATAEAFESNIYENVSGTFDMIVTNPPIRAGKSVVLKILRGAKDYLTESGNLWFVIRKDQGAKSIMKELELDYSLEIVRKEKGFYVIRAKTG